MLNLKTLEESLNEALTRKVSVYDILPPHAVGVYAYDKDDNEYYAYWDTYEEQWKSLERKKLPPIESYRFRK